MGPVLLLHKTPQGHKAKIAQQALEPSFGGGQVPVVRQADAPRQIQARMVWIKLPGMNIKYGSTALGIDRPQGIAR